MFLHQLGEPVVGFAPDLGRHHGRKRRAWHLDRQVAWPKVAGIDQQAFSIPAAVADEKACHFFERLLRRGKTDPDERPPRKGFEPFERESEMHAAFVGGERMDLVDNNRARACQHASARSAGEQDEEGLGCRHHDVRRTAPHRRTFGLWSIAGSYEGTNLDV